MTGRVTRLGLPLLLTCATWSIANSAPAADQSVAAPERLTRSNGSMNGNASVGPAGRIGFVSNRSGGWQVWVMAGDGSAPRQLTSAPGTLGYASWTRDGRALLFHQDVDGVFRLFTVAIATGTVSAVPFEDAATVNRLRPTMTPAGRLLFDRRPASADPRHFAIATANADGTGERILTTTAAYHSDARLSPNGRQIVWQVGEGSSVNALHYQVHVMNADGSGARRLTDGPDSSKYPKWSPDGRRIVYTVESRSAPADRDVWIMNADGSGKVRVTDRPGIDFDATWSADGRALIYTTDQFGGREIVRVPAPSANR